MAGEDRIGAGYKAIYVGRVNPDGYTSGNIAGEASNGQLVRLTRLRGAQTFPVTVPEDQLVPAPGDNETLVTFTFSGDELPSGLLGVAVHDMDFDALCQGTRVEAIGSLRAGAYAPGNKVSSGLCFFMMREAKKFEGSVKGTAAWEWLNVPSCEATPLGAEWAQRTFNPYNYKISTNMSARAPYGATYTELGRGATEVALEPIDADYPGEIYVGFSDGSTDTYTLTTTPITADGNRTHLYYNGVKQAYTTNYTVSGTTLTLVSPPAAGVHLGYMQEIAAASIT